MRVNVPTFTHFNIQKSFRSVTLGGWITQPLSKGAEEVAFLAHRVKGGELSLPSALNRLHAQKDREALMKIMQSRMLSGRAERHTYQQIQKSNDVAPEPSGVSSAKTSVPVMKPESVLGQARRLGLKVPEWHPEVQAQEKRLKGKTILGVLSGISNKSLGDLFQDLVGKINKALVVAGSSYVPPWTEQLAQPEHSQPWVMQQQITQGRAPAEQAEREAIPPPNTAKELLTSDKPTGTSTEEIEQKRAYEMSQNVPCASCGTDLKEHPQNWGFAGGKPMCESCHSKTDKVKTSRIFSPDERTPERQQKFAEAKSHLDAQRIVSSKKREEIGRKTLETFLSGSGEARKALQDIRDKVDALWKGQTS